MNRKINKTTCSKSERSGSRATTQKATLIISAIALASCSIPFAAHAEDENTTFQVNVKESLSVSISSPISPAYGGVDEFLRNKYTLNVSSNNAQGFTASMYSAGDTNLTNKSLNDQIIPTLGSSSTRGAFPTNYWGYSLRDNVSGSSTVYGETEEGNNNSNYYPLVSTSATPITVLHSDTSGSGSQDIYFGTKANSSKAAGTYSGIVIISVVSGVVDDSTNPITPVNPAGPNTDNQVAKYFPSPKGGSNSGVTTYTYRRTNYSNNTRTTTTEISEGDNRTAYNGYIPPQGVKESSTSDINNESSLAAGLATTAAVAAAAGMFFFILVKRREDDEDEEEGEQTHAS